MKDFLLACIVLATATIIALLIHSPYFSTQFFLPILGSLLILTLGTLAGFYLPVMNPYRFHFRYILVFLSVLIIYLFVLSTGALYSPFLIILFLMGFVFSLMLSFPIALAFMAFSFALILTAMIAEPNLAMLLSLDPVKAGLYLVTFLMVLPLYQILTSRYHLKDKTLKHLSAEVNVEDSLLDEVNELVIVTDTEFHILSINDAVETFLHRSRSEIIDQPLFDIVYLQDQNGVLLSKDLLDLNPGIKPLSPRSLTNLRLITTPLFADSVSLYMKPIPDFEGEIIQLLFIISDSKLRDKNAPVSDVLAHTKIRYRAMVEALKKHLKQLDSPASLYQLILLTNIQEDVLNTQTLEEHGVSQKKTKVDLAKLCKQTMLAERDFAEAFRVKLQFLMPDFGEKDVSPLVTDVMKVSPEDFTGPFFTTMCDTQSIRLIIQKLLDVATLLASKEQDPIIEISIERKDQAAYTVSITCPSPMILPEEVRDLSLKFYGSLTAKTNLNAGSGLEGYIAKTISDQLHLPLEIAQTKNPSQIRWTIQIPKE